MKAPLQPGADAGLSLWSQWRKDYDVWAAAQHNVYDQWAPLLRALGLCPVPIVPGEKAPGEYIGCGRYRRLSDWSKRTPIMSSQPGAGIGVRLGEGLVAVDIDADDEGFKAKLMSAIVPPERETVSRIGGRGELFFLRVHPGRKIKTQKFPINKSVVLELLGVGSQCVLPPTIHPKSGKPYRWGANGWTLFNTDLEILPEWPE